MPESFSPNIHTFDRQQTSQVLSALRHFIDADLLSVQERAAAGDMIRQLETMQRQGGGPLYTRDKEEKLLQDTMAALWGTRED